VESLSRTGDDEVFAGAACPPSPPEEGRVVTPDPFRRLHLAERRRVDSPVRCEQWKVAMVERHFSRGSDALITPVGWKKKAEGAN
jgi:hypothetical protein